MGLPSLAPAKVITRDLAPPTLTILAAATIQSLVMIINQAATENKKPVPPSLTPPPPTQRVSMAISSGMSDGIQCGRSASGDKSPRHRCSGEGMSGTCTRRIGCRRLVGGFISEDGVGNWGKRHDSGRAVTVSD